MMSNHRIFWEKNNKSDKSLIFLYSISFFFFFFFELSETIKPQKAVNTMRTILPDEKTQSTNIELMTTCNAITRLVFLSIFVVVIALICFVPPSTRHQTTHTQSVAIPLSKVSNSGRFRSFDPLSSFAILSIKPYLNKAVKDQDITVTGVARLYDRNMQMVSDRNISLTKKITCDEPKNCKPFTVMSYNFVDFQYCSLTADVVSGQSKRIFHKVEFSSTSLSPYISIIFFVFIAAFTVILSVTLICFVPRRLYPTRPDHWSTLVLAFAAFFLDGPWLILKYYVPKLSNGYDVMPELYHIVFIFFFMSFFNAQTHGWANRVFGSWVIAIVIAVCLLVIIVLENIITNLVPLNATSVFLDESIYKFPTLALTFVIHAIIIAMIIAGVCTVQIRNDATLILVSMSILLVEVLEIVRVCLRFYAPLEHLGYSFAADVFYILVANYVTSFFLRNNLPVALAINEEMKQEIKDPMLPDTEDNNAQINDIDTTQL